MNTHTFAHTLSHIHSNSHAQDSPKRLHYEVATISRLPKNMGLFCKRALLKRQYSAKETYNFKEPTDRSHPIACTHEKEHESYGSVAPPFQSVSLSSLSLDLSLSHARIHIHTHSHTHTHTHTYTHTHTNTHTCTHTHIHTHTHTHTHTQMQ